MTGYDLLKRAVSLLGYEGNDVVLIRDKNPEVIKGFINQILCDLKIEEISDLSQTPSFDRTVAETVVYGLAMLLSLTEGESEKNRVFTDIYNKKRSAVLKNILSVKDVLPKITDGLV